MNTSKQKNLYWQEGEINRSHKESLLGGRGFILWFTGLSGSGKSSLANALTEYFHDQKRLTFQIDGDELRQGLNSDLSFSTKDICESNRRVGEMAKLALNNGNIVIVSLISPFRKSRDFIRSINRPGDFIEIHCAASLKSCAKRDKKGLYKKAESGEIQNFIGGDIPYEAPLKPELVLPSDEKDLSFCLQIILTHLKEQNYL